MNLESDYPFEVLNREALKPHLETPADLVETKERYLREFVKQHKYSLAGEDTKALVVGRFQPPHAGHMYLIEAALSVANTVYVGIGSANKKDRNNPLPPEERKEIIADYLREKLGEQEFLRRVRFIKIDDVGDNDPWARSILAQTGPISAVVGNSNWVNRIFGQPEFENQGIQVLRPTVFARDRFEGKKLRMEFRSSGDLFPRKQPARVG